MYAYSSRKRIKDEQTGFLVDNYVESKVQGSGKIKNTLLIENTSYSDLVNNYNYKFITALSLGHVLIL